MNKKKTNNRSFNNLTYDTKIIHCFYSDKSPSLTEDSQQYSSFQSCTIAGHLCGTKSNTF